MSDFKIGDRVLIDGEKFVVVQTDSKKYMGKNISAKNEDDYNHDCHFSDQDCDMVKKIFKVKNGVVYG